MAESKTLTFKEKLLELQKRIKSIKKDSPNPYYKSFYFDINSLLSEIKPHLNDLGLILTQPIMIKDGHNVLITTIGDVDSALNLESSIMLPEGLDAQKMGAAITYFRRYSLQSLLSIEAEDDDGNAAVSSVMSNNNPLFKDEPKYEVVKETKENGYGEHFEKKKIEIGKSCNFCETGTYILNPKTGKIFCDKKCFLKNKIENHEQPPF